MTCASLTETAASVRAVQSRMPSSRHTLCTSSAVMYCGTFILASSNHSRSVVPETVWLARPSRFLVLANHDAALSIAVSPLESRLSNSNNREIKNEHPLRSPAADGNYAAVSPFQGGLDWRLVAGWFLCRRKSCRVALHEIPRTQDCQPCCLNRALTRILEGTSPHAHGSSMM